MKKSASCVTTVGALAGREDGADARHILILVQHDPLCTRPPLFFTALMARKKAFAIALLPATHPPRTRHVRSTMSSYDGVSLAFSDLDLLSTAVDHSEDDPTASRTRG